MLKTLCLVANGSSLPTSEGLPVEFSLTERLTQVAVGLTNLDNRGPNRSLIRHDCLKLSRIGSVEGWRDFVLGRLLWLAGSQVTCAYGRCGVGWR